MKLCHSWPSLGFAPVDNAPQFPSLRSVALDIMTRPVLRTQSKSGIVEPSCIWSPCASPPSTTLVLSIRTAIFTCLGNLSYRVHADSDARIHAHLSDPCTDFRRPTTVLSVTPFISSYRLLRDVGLCSLPSSRLPSSRYASISVSISA